jgi:hypothetical protein
MKVFRLSRNVIRFADIRAPLCALVIALASGGASALEIPLPPFEPPLNPVFPIFRRYFGPERELCAATSGALTARTACRASEETVDPTGLTICARTTGAISLAGPKCPRGSTEVDLRAIRNTSPPTWFGAQSVPPPFQVLPPISTPINPPIGPGTPAPFPFPVTTAKVLCQRGSRLTLRAACLPNETTIHPSALMSCMKRSGSVSIQAGACARSETHLDLRAVRGPATNPIGIGPLVGLVPSLADLVAEYSN